MVNTIYIIKNKISDKFYIGQTWQKIEYRFSFHCHCGHHGCPKLYNAIKKYGKENFTIEPLMYCYNQAQADFYEDYFISAYKAIEIGYNLKEGGRGGGGAFGRNKEKYFCKNNR